MTFKIRGLSHYILTHYETPIDNVIIMHILFLISFGLVGLCIFFGKYGSLKLVYLNYLEVSLEVEVVFSLVMMVIFDFAVLIFGKNSFERLRELILKLISFDEDFKTEMVHSSGTIDFIELILMGYVAGYILSSLYFEGPFEYYGYFEGRIGNSLLSTFIFLWILFFTYYLDLYLKFGVLKKFLVERQNKDKIFKKLLLCDRISFLPSFLIILIVVLSCHFFSSECGLPFRTIWKGALPSLYADLLVFTLFLLILLFLFKRQLDRLIPLLEDKKRVNEIMGKLNLSKSTNEG